MSLRVDGSQLQLNGKKLGLLGGADVYNKILLATDGSENAEKALEHATRIAAAAVLTVKL